MSITNICKFCQEKTKVIKARNQGFFRVIRIVFCGFPALKGGLKRVPENNFVKALNGSTLGVHCHPCGHETEYPMATELSPDELPAYRGYLVLHLLSMALARVCLSAYLMSMPMGIPQARRVRRIALFCRRSIR